MIDKESKKSVRDILQAPKGMRDLVGQDFLAMQGFFERAQSIAHTYGFSGIQTPILEHTEIFLKGLDADDDAIKEMYAFTTKGGDDLAMRPEGTAPVMRAYIEQGMASLPQPVFLYYFGPNFRHEKPQKGRYRQFHQFGLEIMGSPKPMFDALIIQTGYHILKETGKDIAIKLNTLGNKENRETYVAGLVDYYKSHESSLGEQDRVRLETNPLRILDSKDPQTVEVNKNAPTLVSTLNKESEEHFNEVKAYLDVAGIPYEIDHTLVRGLDYYTHTVFEYIARDELVDGKPLALGGGGRYDGLAEAMGHNRKISSVGLGLGVERIIELAPEGTFTSRILEQPQFCVIPLGKEAEAHSYKMLTLLRENNLSSRYLIPPKDGLGASLAQAENLGATHAVILGEQELATHSVIVRSLDTREQETIPFEELINYLKERI